MNDIRSSCRQPPKTKRSAIRMDKTKLSAKIIHLVPAVRLMAKISKT